jgi:Leucine-rich repeat (LRR) protein
MDFDGALQDDVLPFVWNRPLRDEYVTADRASIDAESLHLYIEPRERTRWVRQLPRMNRLRFLEVKSRPNQELFEAICRVPNLERLNIYWSNIVDLEPVRSLRKLTHFNLGSSPKVKSLEPLGELRSLSALGLIAPRSCSDLQPVGKLTRLRGLSLGARDYTTHVYDSLVPLAGLSEIVYFSIFAIRTKDSSLQPLSSFSKLKYLHLLTLSNWPAEEYVRLRASLPHVDCEELRKAANDADFRRANRIR